MAADSATITYDNLGRIKTITYANGTVVTYSYDSTGNRTSVVTSCPSGTC
jgi:YD repeat-containing protein